MAQRWTEKDTSRYVTVGDHKLHYHDTGEGPVVVLLHGSAPASSGWMTWGQNLPAFAKRFRVLAVDLVGFGGSDKPPIEGEYLSFHANAVHRLLEHLGVERAGFVGLSLGGGVSLRLALDTAGLVARMVLLSPLGAVKRTDNWANIRNALGRVAENPTRQNVEQLLRGFVARQELITPEFVEERHARFSDPDTIGALKNTANYYANLTPERVRGLELWRDLERVAPPTLLVFGRDDRIGSLEGAMATFRSLPNARLWALPNAGHWPHVEQLEEFNAYVIPFLAAGA